MTENTRQRREKKCYRKSRKPKRIFPRENRLQTFNSQREKRKTGSDRRQWREK